MERDIILEAKKLKQRYPYKFEFGLEGDSLNNENMVEVMKIKQRE